MEIPIENGFNLSSVDLTMPEKYFSSLLTVIKWFWSLQCYSKAVIQGKDKLVNPSEAAGL